MGEARVMKKNVTLLVVMLGVFFIATGTAFAQDKPDFSTKRGFFTSAFSLTLSIDDAAGSIRYTLDGSTPTTTTGTLYTTPLTISKTSTVRAIACYSDGTYSAVATNTYIFVADVITQCSDGKAPNTSWPTANSNSSRSQIIDYGMDPDVVNSTTYSGLVDDALLAIPTLSLVTDLSNFFNSSTGIYMNASEDGEDWERPVSVELINPDGSDGFQIDCGIRIRGGMSRQYSNPKHAFRLFFRSDYGSSRLDYDLFGNEGADSFDKVDLRTEQNYSWSKDGSTSNTMVREVWARDTQGAMGEAYTRSRYYHLYIDGIYWGIYQTEERPESSFAESYFGDDEANYDVMKVDSTTHEVGVNDGTIALWQSLWSAAVTGFTTDARYYSVQGKNSSGVTDSSYKKLLDIDNVIDYMSLIYYDGDLDAPISNCLQNSKPNNFYAIINRVTPDGFSFIAHDGEWTLLKTTENRLGPYSVGTQLTQFNPQWLLQKLMSHPEFLMHFADRVQKHLYNGGALSQEKCTARFQKRASQIDTAIIAESARWGDAKSTTALTRSDWLTAVNYVVNTYFPARTAAFISQLRAKSWFPTIDAPSLLINGKSSSGGVVETGDSLTMTSGSSYIYYTLDGTDPRVKVSVAKEDDLTSAEKAAGAISSAAILYSGAVNISDPTTRVLARAYSGSVWSALVDLTFTTGDPVSNLRITEIMYNPTEDEDSEFIELQNVGNVTVGLAGISFTDGVLFNFTEGELAPGEYALLVRDQTVFESIYGTGLPVFGVYKGSLDNAGETLTCETSSGDVIQSFVFSDEWQTTTDGGGYSLTFIDPTLSDLSAWSVGTNWKASSVLGGTPGAADSTNVTGPTAAFSASSTSGDAPLSVAFTDSSTAGSSSITSWSWSFGDGSASTSQNPSHSYSSAGTYTVSLTVTTSAGSDTETKTGYITVTTATVAPTAAFSVSQSSGTAPLSVVFTDASTSGSASITSWSWSFGDGSTSAEQNPTHIYTAAGIYSVSLTVTTSVGSDSETKTGCVSVVVLPTAAFTASQTSGEAPLSVTFTDSSTSGSSSISAWYWTFGDGSTSTSQNPSHTYSSAGTYSVLLTVTTAAGSDSETKSEYITVTVAPAAAFSASQTSGSAPLTVAFTDSSTPGSSAITSWAWSFGDGYTSASQNPSHTYSTAGTYSVALTVTTAVGSNTETKADYITVVQPPTADFDASETSGTAPLTVSFADFSSAGSASITKWYWSFGDGSTSSAQNPTHAYSSAGSYTVSLTVTTSVGSDTETKTNYITVTSAPTAAFSISETSGAAPFTVTFSDASTAGSAAITSWSWSFGDGSTSAAQNPSHTYSAAGSYTVSLTVTTSVGSDTETKDACVSVYVLPTAAFSASETSGAIPLAVAFTDASTAGSAAIASWSWNFGDGSTSAAQNPSHTYSAAGSYTVSLTVTTSVGSDVETKTNYIVVATPPSAAFNISETSGAAPLTVSFTDVSTSGDAAITSWLWSFGDGSTSSEQNPTHTYSDAGTYSVSLTVVSSVGSDVETKTDCVTALQLPVAAFVASETTGTAPLSVAFTDASTPGGAAITSWLWSFGDGSTSSEQNPTHSYSAAGTYDVSLVVATSVGSDSEVKQAFITVEDAPVSPTAGFTASQTTGAAPFTVAFTDSSLAGSAAISSWAWDFGDGSTSSAQNPTHVYTVAGTYTIILTVTTSVGSDSEAKEEYIVVADTPVTPVSPTAAFSASNTVGTAPLSISFMDESKPGTSAITSWVWNFGDGETSNVQNPTHVYESVGTYTVELTVTTTVGSDSETKEDYVTVSETPVGPTAAFSASETTGAAPFTTSFTDASVPGTASITSWRWSFGDGETSDQKNPTHEFASAGSYTVSLTVATSVGSDTETKESYITVYIAPTAAFSASETTGATPLSVSFADASTAGSSPITAWAWNFGDGSTSALQNPSHVYNVAGTYAVSLMVATSVGSDVETKEGYVTVYTLPTAAFNASETTGVAPLSVTFADASTAGSSPITSWVWDFGDGSTSALQNPTHEYDAAGTYSVSLTVTTSDGSDVETKTGCVTVATLPTAAFSASATSGVTPLSIVFSDASVSGSSSITSWAWSFGDGSTSSLQNPTHVYEAAGTYDVSLVVTSAVGSDEETKTGYITVTTLPTAAFSASATSGPAPLSVTFTDASVAGSSPITAWYWSFGDGSTSSLQNPSHAYASAGIYSVTLTVTTSAGVDKETKADYITVTNPPQAAFSVSTTSGSAPLSVTFTDASVAGASSITAWNWTFGDGDASTTQNPTHIYESAGSYTVSLTVISDSGADTETKTDYIKVIVPPTAAFKASETTGSAPLSVTFTDSSTAGSSAITAWWWSFGDGETSALQNPTHEYSKAGSYAVSLTVTTAVGVDTETKSGYIIIVELPTAAFSASETSGTAPLSVTFTDASSPGSSSITAWSWTFGDGSTSSLQNPTHVYTASGVYAVSLTVTTTAGANTGMIEDYITVADPLTAPTSAFSAGVTSGEVPLTVEFSDLSDPGSSEIVEWLWSFGDGWTSDAQNPTHVYSDAGVYTVSLTVTTEAGTDTETKDAYITVTEASVAPTAAFNISTTSGTAPLTVAFTDASTAGSAAIKSWLWSFGDGWTSTLKNPTHAYTEAGTYTVTLTVTSSAGSDTTTKAACITVDEENGFGCFAGNTKTVSTGDWAMLFCMAAGFVMTARRRRVSSAISKMAESCVELRLK